MTILGKSAAAAVLGLALLAAGCAGGSRSSAGAGAAANYAAASALAGQMTARDESALARAFVAAMEDGADGEPAVWSSGAYSGAVVPGARLVANLKPDPATMLPAAPGLALDGAFETELGLHAIARTANLRAGPSTDAAILSTLVGGTAVDVVGRTEGRPWMLVAIDGTVRGFVHEDLTVKAPGAALELAGGPVRRAVPCRAYEQRLALYGRTDRWSGVACRRDGRWDVEQQRLASAG